ncbi:hypothetical protein GIB67_005707 [Kingdonia uniflora]|uniref:Exostosin GT47 domain-containing protein n=1 Tax=Kingdonia uniflora TaxID=39325 RepID=A0A7J7KVC9_9MAGN|nr:hypothetical protein GIB67_005707 [Kingdonia uniflora]
MSEGVCVSRLRIEKERMNSNRVSSSSTCWFSSCSSSLLLVVSLILVSGVVFTLGPKSFTSSSWAWSSGLPSSSSSGITDIVDRPNSSGPKGGFVTKGRERHAGFHHIRQEHQEALTDDTFAFNFSFTPPLDKETIELKPPEENKGVPTYFMNVSDGPASPAPSPAPTPTSSTEERVYSKLEQLEAGLVKVRASIREAAQWGSELLDPEYVPRGPIYRNPRAFHRSYLEMEKQFKVYVYKEGELPLFHNGPCKSIYSMEGNFIHELEIDSQFRTQDPDKAHVYFLPFSVTLLVRFIYLRDSHDISPIKRVVVDYVNVVADKYPYWNRSLGADHFMLSCHDWGPETSTFIPNMQKNSIRALCNANTSEGFNPTKDVSFPEIHLKTGDTKGYIGGPSASHRPILAFFAGGLHGPIRPILLEHWKNKDADMQIYQNLPKTKSYYEMMKTSKYCLCPSGYEVASPRIVEAIYSGCVPVLISDHYVPPFSDVLNWKSFSVGVPVNRIPELKNILMSISSRQYIRLQRRGFIARRHFEVNSPPKRFDVFHMILHSIWLRRLNVHIHD